MKGGVIIMISIEDFNSGNFRRRNNKGSEHPVYLFLKRNCKKAFTTAEITKYLKLNRWTVRGVLANLKKDGLITHKAPYFAYKNNVKPKHK